MRYLLFLLLLASCAPQQTEVPNESGEVVMIGLNRDGYVPSEIIVEHGKPVTLRNDGTIQGCGSFLIQKELGINANFAKSNEYTFTPNKRGTFTMSCSMGMYHGTIQVI